MDKYIYTYPELRRKTILSKYLDEISGSVFKSFLDVIRAGSNENNIFLIAEKNDFVLLVFFKMPFDSNKECVNIYTKNDFSKLNNDFSDHLYKKALSFIFYKTFYIDHSEITVIFADSRKDSLIDEIKETGFSFNGMMAMHYDKNDAFIYSMTNKEFSAKSTGAMKFFEHHLIIKTTNLFVTEISVVRDNDKAGTDIVNTADHISTDAFPILSYALEQLSKYLTGKLKSFDIKPETELSTEFQKNVWKHVMDIPYGQTASYEDIAKKTASDRHTADAGLLTRAVGMALSKNPVMILIPCHRVIGKDGKLRGFAGGVDIKDSLLTHELTNFGDNL